MTSFYEKYPVGSRVQFSMCGKTECRRITAHARIENNHGYVYGLVFHNSMHKMPTYFNEKGEGAGFGIKISGHKTQ